MREIVGPEIQNIGPIYRGCCYYYTFIKCKRAKSAPGPAPGPASALAWLSLGRPAGSASGRSVRAGARPEAEPGRITGLGHPWPGPARPRPRLGSARPPACEIPQKVLMRFSGLVFGFSSPCSTLVSLRFSAATGCCAPCCVVPLWALCRSAPLVLFGGCEGRPSCLSLRPSCLDAPSAFVGLHLRCLIA